MITKIKIAAGTIAFSIGLALVYADSCPNKGIVQGDHACSTADNCSNHKSRTTCTTAVIYNYFPNTGTVNGAYTYQESEECTTDITCEWVQNVNKCQVPLVGGR